MRFNWIPAPSGDPRPPGVVVESYETTLPGQEGYALVRVVEITAAGSTERHAYLEEIWAATKGSGVGQDLLKDAEELARSRGCVRIGAIPNPFDRASLSDPKIPNLDQQRMDDLEDWYARHGWIEVDDESQDFKAACGSHGKSL